MIIAGFIFSVVAVALSGVFSYHYQAIGSSRLFLVGQYLAREKMDELMNAGFEKAPIVAGPNTDPFTPITVTFTIRDSPVQVIYEVDDQWTPVPPGHLNVIVTVSWTEANRIRNVRYSASISPNA